MPSIQKQLQVLLAEVEALFPTPDDVPENAGKKVFAVACEVDELADTIIGGIRSRSFTTEAVIDGMRQLDVLLVQQSGMLTPEQQRAPRAVQEVFQRA